MKIEKGRESRSTSRDVVSGVSLNKRWIDIGSEFLRPELSRQPPMTCCHGRQATTCRHRPSMTSWVHRARDSGIDRVRPTTLRGIARPAWTVVPQSNCPRAIWEYCVYVHGVRPIHATIPSCTVRRTIPPLERRNKDSTLTETPINC